MAIDNGPSVTEQWIKVGYIKQAMNGLLLTEKGIEWFTIAFQELYNEITMLHQELDRIYSKKDCTACNRDDICRSDENRDGEV